MQRVGNNLTWRQFLFSIWPPKIQNFIYLCAGAGVSGVSGGNSARILSQTPLQIP